MGMSGSSSTRIASIKSTGKIRPGFPNIDAPTRIQLYSFTLQSNTIGLSSDWRYSIPPGFLCHASLPRPLVTKLLPAVGPYRTLLSRPVQKNVSSNLQFLAPVRSSS